MDGPPVDNSGNSEDEEDEDVEENTEDDDCENDEEYDSWQWATAATASHISLLVWVMKIFLIVFNSVNWITEVFVILTFLSSEQEFSLSPPWKFIVIVKSQHDCTMEFMEMPWKRGLGQNIWSQFSFVTFYMV